MIMTDYLNSGPFLYMKFILFLFCCVTSLSFIFNNELNNNDRNDYLRIILYSLGVFVVNGIFEAFKYLLFIDSNLNILLLFYCNISNTIISLLFSLLNFTSINLSYITYTFINGFIVCNLSSYFNDLSIRYLSLNKSYFLNFTYVIFVFILSFLLLNENIYSTDLLSALLLNGFLLMNYCEPLAPINNTTPTNGNSRYPKISNEFYCSPVSLTPRKYSNFSEFKDINLEAEIERQMLEQEKNCSTNVSAVSNSNHS